MSLAWLLWVMKFFLKAILCTLLIVQVTCFLNDIFLENVSYFFPYYLSIYKYNFFLFQISDDDRMSLTTAVSDEDDGESVMNSPYKAKQTGTAAASFNCTGAVRKAG